MNLKDLQDEWKKDSVINSAALDEESLKIPSVFEKYMRIYVNLSKSRAKLNTKYKKEYKIKWAYYTGKLSEEELEEYDLEQFDIHLRGNQVEIYLNGDEKLAEIKEQLSIIDVTLNFLEQVIKMINSRGFQIKNAVDWRKFTHGVN